MNKLHNQVSPYLLQHKNNPVDWQPWGEEALSQAVNEDKPIILSIGYAACHWCHVMEHESFEDLEVAELMNAHFINIKVDREERPDIDQIYMEAIHQMGLSGGWPLNVFLMPDQKPFYGGTYFPKNKWIQVLYSINEAFKNHKNELQQSANGFQQSMNEMLLTSSNLQDYYSVDFQKRILQMISSSIDPYFGGINKAPKFPMPTLWNFLEEALKLPFDTKQIEHLLDNTLHKMAQGGIFDHVDGGFSRYSVDSEWFCPHFEKMLYDNGQLLSVFANAYKRTSNLVFKEIIDKTLSFHEKTLLGNNGLYYASLDADSEQEEGKFYIWSFKELNDLIPYESNKNFYEDFSISIHGNWEDGKNILFKKRSFLSSIYSDQLQTLYKVRKQRIAPSLDNKQLLSWNAMYLIGLIDVYRVTKDTVVKEKIESLFQAIENYLYQQNKWLHQAQYTNQPIEAFLDDLAFMALAYLKWFLLTNNEHYLNDSNKLIEYIRENFFDSSLELFTYANRAQNRLIANIPELIDSVIPSSNSVVLECLFYQGQLLEIPSYTILGNKILEKVLSKASDNPSYFSNWWRMMLTFKWNEKIIVKVYNSNRAVEDIKLHLHALSDQIIVIEKKSESLQESYLVCQGEHCFAPLQTFESLVELIKEII